MIRSATQDDLPDILPIFDEIYAKSPFARGRELDVGHIRRMFAVGVTMPNFFVEVVEEDGKIVGCLAGMIAETVWGTKIATDLFVSSSKDTHKLIKRFIKWAKERKADGVTLNNISGNPRFDRLIERLGLSPVGTKFLEIF